MDLTKLEQIALDEYLEESGIEESTDGIYIVPSWHEVNDLVEAVGKSIDEIFDDWAFNDMCELCYECRNAIYTVPGFIGEMPYYWRSDDGIFCGDCVKSTYEEEYLEHLLNNPKVANTILTNEKLKELSFVECECNGDICLFEAGFSHFQDPVEIMNNARERHDEFNFIFEISAIGQFSIEYKLWRRKINSE